MSMQGRHTPGVITLSDFNRRKPEERREKREERREKREERREKIGYKTAKASKQNIITFGEACGAYSWL